MDASSSLCRRELTIRFAEYYTKFYNELYSEMPTLCVELPLVVCVF